LCPEKYRGGNKSEGFEFNQHGVYFIYGALLSAVGVGYFLRIGMDDEKKPNGSDCI